MSPDVPFIGACWGNWEILYSPPSDAVLDPAPHILDCEIQDWAVDLRYRLHLGHDSPRAVAAEKANQLQIALCGLMKRPLWIAAYDLVGLFNTDYDQTDIILSSFVDTFDDAFWSVIPDSNDPVPDGLEKQHRIGLSSEDQTQET